MYPAGPDPGTGGRQLEQLAFEIISTQSLARATTKAVKLTMRGVRRVLAMDVERSRVLEWSTDRSTWCELDAAGHIDDPALEVPLPIEAMVHAAKADDAVARALVARHNSVIETVRAEDRAAGKIEGKIEALFAILAAREMDPDGAARERILRERDPRRLDRWIARAAVAASLAEVLDRA